MANFVTNLFFASTENENDLDRIEAFLDDNFGDCYIERIDDTLKAEFSSRLEYPEKEINKLVDSLEAKGEIYIRILSYEFEDEYVSFRRFSKGEWKIEL